ncbi:MAG: glycosyltransferase [Acidobacteriota bacterium]|nr:glycosyltransferase [Acidobacteriota bacterium]
MNPRISIVTTNYNGAAFLEQAIRSVLDQGYQNLEYIVIDGGSTDGSQKIIEKYEKRLAYWESEKDRGFAHAYNKGFAKASGEILAYLNSDDMYCPWAFEMVGRSFSDIPEMQWLTTLFPMVHSPETGFITLAPAQPYNRELYYANFYNGRILQWVQQESTFWRRFIWQKAGGCMNESLKLAIDSELWSRFFELTELYAITTPLGGFRGRPDSKSGLHLSEYLDEMSQALNRSIARTGIKINLRPKHVNPLTAWLLNSPRRVVPRRWRYHGKVVTWNFVEKKFAAQDTIIRF